MISPEAKNSSVEIRANSPDRFSSAELEEFRRIVRDGGEVPPDLLAAGTSRSKLLLFLLHAGRAIGTSALKVPLNSYRSKVSRQIGVAIPESEFPYEVGYTCIVEKERGKKYAHLLMEATLERSRGVGLMATVRAENKAMRHILEKVGFESTGLPYPSERGEYNLVLYLRRPPRASVR